jgi:hypothetical protein
MARKKRSKRDTNIQKIEEQIFDISEVSPYVRLLAYGKNGKGKTRLAASFPKTLIIDVNEEGTRSARQFRGTKVFRVREWSDIAAIYWYLQRGEHDFETVAIDTISQLNVMALRRAMKEKTERDPNADPKQPRRQDWGKAAEMMKGILLQFRNLPMHVVFLAQERTEGDPEEGEDIMHVPNLPAGSRGTAMDCVGIIGRVYQKEVKVKKKGKRQTKWVTCMLVGPHDEYESKDRTADSGVLGRITVNPTGKKIIESWEAAPPGEE